MAHSPAVTKAVIPVAGMGTRFLPATKATPKEMLPVIDTPAIHYVVEEAVTAGIDNVLLVTGRGKRSIEDYFDRNTELEAALAAKGDEAGLATVRALAPTSPRSTMSARARPAGLGHAVLCAADHVGDVPFAVLLGDDFIHPEDHLLRRMIDVRQRYGGSVVALMEVEPEQVSSLRGGGLQADRRRRTSSRSPTWSRSPAWATPRRTGSSSAATSATRRSSTCSGRPRRAGAARSSSPTRCARWPGPTATRATTGAAACTACCSAAVATTPATSWTTCAPRSSSPVSGPTSRRSSCPGCAATWPAWSSRSRWTRLISTWPKSRPPSSRCRRASWPWPTPTARSWPATSPPSGRCPRSTTRPWTATPCWPVTWPGPAPARRSRCPWTARSRPATPAPASWPPAPASGS